MKDIESTLPGLSKREILEGMRPEALVDHILSMGEKVTIIENEMNLASNVLEGAYGVTVDQVLADRDARITPFGSGEKQNGAKE